jgi:hypothetical protein
MLRAKLEDEESILATQRTVEALLEFVKEVHALAATLHVRSARLVFKPVPLHPSLNPLPKNSDRGSAGGAKLPGTHALSPQPKPQTPNPKPPPN